MVEAYYIPDYSVLGHRPTPTGSYKRNYKTQTERFVKCICFCRQVKSLGGIYEDGIGD
jgi:hypothetical protein